MSERRPHQWWCGGKEPCACTDSWKEGGWKDAVTAIRVDELEAMREKVTDLRAKLAEAEAKDKRLHGLYTELLNKTGTVGSDLIRRLRVTTERLTDEISLQEQLIDITCSQYDRAEQAEAREAALREALEAIRDHKPHPEIIHDKWAYERLDHAYREAARAALATPSKALGK